MNGSPRGAGKLFWMNGATWSGEILDNLGTETRVDAKGLETKASFKWDFHLTDHTFSYGNLAPHKLLKLRAYFTTLKLLPFGSHSLSEVIET